MDQNPRAKQHEPDPMKPGYPPPLRQPGSGYFSPPGVSQVPTQASQHPPVPNYPGYQANLAAAQGYPGYQPPLDTTLPTLPPIQVEHYYGYNQPAIAPIILPPPPPPRQKRRRGLAVLIALIALLLIAGGSFGFVTYNNQQNVIQASATARVLKQAATAHVLATTKAIASTYPFSNHLVLNDPLTSSNYVSQYGWDNTNAYCAFNNNTYQASINQANSYIGCFATKPSFTNLTFQVQMNIQEGGIAARGGLIFRGNANSFQFYILSVDTQGNYQLAISVNAGSLSGRILRQGTISTFTPGLNQNNTLGVVAKGDQISFYANQQFVTRVTDSTYSSGQVGVVSYYGTSNTTVAYTNARVWQL